MGAANGRADARARAVVARGGRMMRVLRALLVTLVCALCWSVPVTAQEAPDPVSPAVLIADRVFLSADGEMVAEGAVQAYQGEIKLTARRITYDRRTETLAIEGPIRLDDGAGITILASAAEMD